MNKQIVKFFPEPSEVFFDRVEEHSKVLFPLHTLDLNQINGNWTGVIHTLKYNEDPYNKAAVGAFTDYCEDCIIGFNIIDGKYSFMSDLKYFDRRPDWERWFDETKQSFETAKKVYLEKGETFGLGIDQIGGEPEWVQGEWIPNDPDGNPMDFICHIYDESKDIYLFYSDLHKIAVFLYQTT
jgi:hypothetical protein